MAGMRNIVAGTRRAASVWLGLNTGAATNVEKLPDLCYQDSLSSISSAGTTMVPMLSHSSANLVTTVQKQLFSIPLASLASIGLYIRATTIATDGTDMQSFVERIQIAAVNKAGSYTSAVTNLSTVGAKAVSAGTLTTTWAVVTGTNAIIVAVTAATSLTPTSFVCHFELGCSMGFPSNGVITYL